MGGDAASQQVWLMLVLGLPTDAVEEFIPGYIPGDPQVGRHNTLRRNCVLSKLAPWAIASLRCAWRAVHVDDDGRTVRRR